MIAWPRQILWHAPDDHLGIGKVAFHLTNVVHMILFVLWHVDKKFNMKMWGRSWIPYLRFINWSHARCMFDKFHFTFNFKSRVSHGVFHKQKMIVKWHLHFNLNCHINIKPLVVHVISVSNMLIDAFTLFYFIVKSHNTCQILITSSCRVICIKK